MACISIICEVWAPNCGYNFDAKILKPLLEIDIFIVNITTQFMLRSHLQKDGYEQFLVQNESGAIKREKLF